MSKLRSKRNKEIEFHENSISTLTNNIQPPRTSTLANKTYMRMCCC